MKTINSFLSAMAFSLAGIAADANAATQKQDNGDALCFQLTPVADQAQTPSSGHNEFNWAPLTAELAGQSASQIQRV